MHPFTVRPAEEADIPHICSAMKELWPDANDLVKVATRGVAAGAPAPIFVAQDAEGNCVGFLYLNLRPYAEGCEGDAVPFIEGWWVAGRMRRKGIGRALVQAAEDWALAHGYREIASDTQLLNHDSQAAHEALGYEALPALIPFRKVLKP